MILTEIGEIGVHAGNRTTILRPSLFAMSQLGLPAEIVAIFATVMEEVQGENAKKYQQHDALAVIRACTDADIDDLFGYWVDGDESPVFVPGHVSSDDILQLARCLLKHGVTGAIAAYPPKPGKEPEYLREFVARDMAAMAMAHLGMNEREAWQMTMTSLVSAMKSKFPPGEDKTPGARAPTKDEHEATMAWYERIEAKRRKRTLH